MHLLSLVSAMKKLNLGHDSFHNFMSLWKFFISHFVGVILKSSSYGHSLHCLLKGGAEYPKVLAQSMLIGLKMDLD